MPAGASLDHLKGYTVTGSFWEREWRGCAFEEPEKSHRVLPDYMHTSMRCAGAETETGTGEALYTIPAVKRKLTQG